TVFQRVANTSDENIFTVCEESAARTGARVIHETIEFQIYNNRRYWQRLLHNRRSICLRSFYLFWSGDVRRWCFTENISMTPGILNVAQTLEQIHAQRRIFDCDRLVI